MQIKTPARIAPRGISVNELPGVNSPTRARTELAPGSQRGRGTYSPNGIRRILSYCAIFSPFSFMRIAELKALDCDGSSEFKRTRVLFTLAKLATMFCSCGSRE